MDLLKVKLLRPGAVLPTRATSGAAGYDLYACLEDPVVIPPGGRAFISSGIAIAIGDPSVAAFVFGRSGLGAKHGISPSNAVGVIDSDYRGEIVTNLVNHSDEPFTVRHGDRYAQMVLMPVLTPELEACQELDDTSRGAGGFGSTGR